MKRNALVSYLVLEVSRAETQDVEEINETCRTEAFQRRLQHTMFVVLEDPEETSQQVACRLFAELWFLVLQGKQKT